MADKKKDYPIKIKIGKPVPAKRKKEDTGSDKLLKGAVERGNREQAREAKELEMMKKRGMKKGGSIDGVAHKGKTRGKMVTMAKGGMTYKRGGKTKC